MARISNKELVFDALLQLTKHQMKMQQILAQAEAEGRDVSDEERDAVMRRNDAKLDALINKRR